MKWLAIALAAALILLTAVRQFYLTPFSTLSANVSWFVIQLLPLLLPLPTAIQGEVRSMFVLSLASMLYFVHGVVVAFDPNMGLYAAFEIAASLGLCASSALFVRHNREPSS